MTHQEYTDKLDELLSPIFAYGVDWQEYKDKSKHDHEVSTFAGKIKAEHITSIITAIQQLNEEAIGEDELNPFGKPRINPYSCDECGVPEEPYTRNQQRQELRNILGASNE